ncbi:MAG: hypothetical protein DRI57_31755 [Deltaproteobacteria bacterium]|nr:MAG: hypothetical protein DRI57_31755 [Deltaproteobacteria bacterium]
MYYTTFQVRGPAPGGLASGQGGTDLRSALVRGAFPLNSHAKAWEREKKSGHAHSTPGFQN